MELQQTQAQKLSQQQLYGTQLLRLGALELEAFVRELAQENPLVELEDVPAAAQPRSHKQQDDLLGRLRWLEDNDRQNWFYQHYSEEELDPLTWVGTGGGLEETLSSFLSRQLDKLKPEAEIRRLVEYLTGCLDDDGYLRTPIQELSQQDGIPLPKLEQALRLLQSLEPAGVGAADLSQCLELQLRRIGEEGPALDIVRQHLGLLAQWHDRVIASRLGISVAQVEQARSIIRELEPRPGAVFQHPEQVHYPQPDLTVIERDGRFLVQSLRDGRPPFRISRYYQELLRQSEDKEVRDYLTGKLHQAENVLWAARQRESTLLRCAQVIADRQSGFFRAGPEHLVPLSMAEVARELELHESTVSRAVREKYLQCARGLYPLSYFFSRSAGNTRAEAGRSGTAVRQVLLRLIGEEDKTHPLSDQQLCQLLAREGCPVSRRTVAKYREELDIPSASGRKTSLP